MKTEIDKTVNLNSSKVNTSLSSSGLTPGSIPSKCFSQHGNLFAIVNDQGILRIWDTETNELKQEYTPNLHLSGPCNTVLWVDFKSKKKSNTLSTEGLHIALGGNSGEVQLYSFNSGKIEGSLRGESHSARINGLAFDGVKLLYSCGDDFQVIVWDLSLGKRVAAWTVGNEKPQSLVYLAESADLVVGGREIIVFSTEDHSQKQKFTGHSSEITTLETFHYDDDDYILSASKLDRVISLWKVSPDSVKSRGCDAISSFQMEDIASMVTCNIDQTDETLVVSACTRSGVVHLYKRSLEELKTVKPLKPKVTIQLATDSGTVIEPIVVVGASLEFSEDAKEVLIAYGDKYFLMFEKRTIDFSQKIDVCVRLHPREALNVKKVGKGAKNQKTVIPTVNPNDVFYKSATAVQSARKTSKPVDTPMDERLQNLHLTKGEIPQNQSKVNLLVQALHSGDNKLLSEVLTTDDPEVIKLTVQKLPAQYVHKLIFELNSRMQMKLNHAETSVNWMKSLVQNHAAQVVTFSSDNFKETAGDLLVNMEQKSSRLLGLYAISGRIDLVLSHLTKNIEEDNLCTNDVLIYQDKDDSSNSDLDPNKMNENLSDDEWDEDEDEESDMEVDE